MKKKNNLVVNIIFVLIVVKKMDGYNTEKNVLIHVQKDIVLIMMVFVIRYVQMDITSQIMKKVKHVLINVH